MILYKRAAPIFQDLKTLNPKPQPPKLKQPLFIINSSMTLIKTVSVYPGDSREIHVSNSIGPGANGWVFY